MAGTKAGGLKARDTNKLRHGDDFYARMGAKGGKNSSGGGFAYTDSHSCEMDSIFGVHRIAQCAGSKGGRVSKRGKAGGR